MHGAHLIECLLDVARDLGDARQMAIMGEGNVSGALDGDTFFVKASGTRLATLRPDELVEVRAAPLLAAVQSDAQIADAEVEALLLQSRLNPSALKPSVEALFHAVLLALPSVRFVAHAHPIACNQLLCSPAAQQFASKRLFPDQVVYCGTESVLIPYVDPGLTLARRIAAEIDTFHMRTRRIPRTILLENHGVITIGPEHSDVLAAMAMAEKSARVFLGASAAGGPIFMPSDQVRRIADRADEHYRQRMLQHAHADTGASKR